MFRGGGNQRSKATSETRCQKCLKYGHYSYECKTSAAERPYAPRPSRMQQLMNPELRPKLSEENSNEMIKREGLPDSITSNTERERVRSRSESISSSDSVSTISTNVSRSLSPPTKRRRHDGAKHAEGARSAQRRNEMRLRQQHSITPRSRSISSSEKSHEASPHRGRQPEAARGGMNAALRSPSRQRGGGRRKDRLQTSHSREDDRRRRKSRSQQGRLEPRESHPFRSRSRSPRKPYHRKEEDRHSFTRNEDRRHDPNRNDRGRKPRSPLHGSYRDRNGEIVTYGGPPRERNLSPYSKRLALTQALNRGPR